MHQMSNIGSLTPEQERRLAWNVNKWATTLDKVSRGLANVLDDITSHRPVTDSGLTMAVNSHMVAICLRQIDAFAEQLEKSSVWVGHVAQKGVAFRKRFAASEIRDLRNVLEHAAEYIVGKGKKPALVARADAGWPGIAAFSGRLSNIQVFGKSYAVGPAIDAALEFADAIRPKVHSP